MHPVLNALLEGLAFLQPELHTISMDCGTLLITGKTRYSNWFDVALVRPLFALLSIALTGCSRPSNYKHCISATCHLALTDLRP